MITNLRKILAPFLIVTLLMVTSCAQQPPSRYGLSAKRKHPRCSKKSNSF